jgi:predicted site-specific integrase-resolvase
LEEKEYLTLKEACQYLGVSRQTIHNYVKKGKLTRYERDAPHVTLYKKIELDRLRKVRPED